MRLDAEDSTTLITGDTDGYLKVWDIEDYCCDISSTLLQDEPGECSGNQKTCFLLLPKIILAVVRFIANGNNAE